MSETLIFAAYDAFLDLIRTALPDLTVFDGPQAGYPDDESFIVYGTDDPIIDGPHTAVDAGVQDWESLGAQSRMETFAIWATLVNWSGDDDYTPLRAAANSQVRAIGQALRPPPHGTGDAMLNNTLNQAGNGVGWCGLTVTRMRQMNTNAGIAVHVPIMLACTGRL